MALTRVTSSVIADNAITSDKISAEVSLGVKIANVQIANSSYTALDDTAVDTAGGYIIINGAGFASGAQVLIDGTAANSVTFVSSTQLKAQIPAKSAATYNLYVVNTDGGTGIRVNGITYSGTPTWVTGSTLDNQAVDVAFNVGFEATGAVSYANTTTLPAGTQLLSNGYFYGTVTGITEETTYNFTVSAIDAENQDSYRTFSVTVTVGPPTGYLYLWGFNYAGQLGLNDRITKSSPVQVGSDSTWAPLTKNSFGMGGDSVTLLKGDGTLWSWGNNGNGQLGFNDRVYRSSPTQVGSLTSWDTVSCGDTVTLARKNDGTLWYWGWASIPTSNLKRSSPTQLGDRTDWSQKFVGGRGITWAITNSGELWMTGSLNYGSSGKNVAYIEANSSPVQLGGTEWADICTNNGYYGGIATMGIKTDGTLWSWGGNGDGALGHNDTTGKSSPTQVGTDTNWVSVKMNGLRASALKSDGSIWVWGNNGGTLGLNDTTNKSSPTQLSGNWTSWIVSGHSAGIKSDGTLWLCGYAWYGSGFNDSVNRSSPTQLGTNTNWVSVTINDYTTWATVSP